MNIGPYSVSVIETGEFALDGGAMFGVVPKTLWNKVTKADDRNRIDMRMRAILLQDGTRNILIETGIGDWWDNKSKDIYRIAHSNYSLEAGLEMKGVRPTDVTDIILTHLHFDHAGGATRRDENGRMVLRFPNAKIYVQYTHAEWAKQPSLKDRGSFIPENLAPILNSDKLVLLDGTSSPFECISFFISDGHTVAQQHPIISDGAITLFHCGDIIPMSFHSKLPWIMAYDVHPLKTAKEKERILEEAIANGWILFFAHCSEMMAATVERGEKGPQLTPVFL